MRAINHALTGALLGYTLPAVAALPLAPVSHYVLDAIPHYGRHKNDIGSRYFRYELAVDGLLCIALVGVLAITTHQWLVPAICAFLGTAPDLMWMGSFIRQQLGKRPRQYHHPLVRLHKWIQWYELPPGAFVEVAWAIAMIVLLVFAAS